MPIEIDQEIGVVFFNCDAPGCVAETRVSIDNGSGNLWRIETGGELVYCSDRCQTTPRADVTEATA